MPKGVYDRAGNQKRLPRARMSALQEIDSGPCYLAELAEAFVSMDAVVLSGCWCAMVIDSVDIEEASERVPGLRVGLARALGAVASRMSRSSALPVVWDGCESSAREFVERGHAVIDRVAGTPARAMDGDGGGAPKAKPSVGEQGFRVASGAPPRSAGRCRVMDAWQIAVLALEKGQWIEVDPAKVGKKLQSMKQWCYQMKKAERLHGEARVFNTEDGKLIVHRV